MHWGSLSCLILLVACVAWVMWDVVARLRLISAAEAKGMQLLLDNLTEEQRNQYRKRGHFDAIGSMSGKRYRIMHGTMRNVLEIGQSVEPGLGRCFMPKGNLVAGDCMLAQKIAIENCEEEVLRTAMPFQPLGAGL